MYEKLQTFIDEILQAPDPIGECYNRGIRDFNFSRDHQFTSCEVITMNGQVRSHYVMPSTSTQILKYDVSMDMSSDVMRISAQLANGMIVNLGIDKSLQMGQDPLGWNKPVPRPADYYSQANIEHRLRDLLVRKRELEAKASDRWYRQSGQASEYVRICNQVREHQLMLDSDVPL
jgi:hypothetical protein